MKRKTAALLTGVLTVSMMLSGCEGSKGLENDNVKITQYKGVEVDEVKKPDEVTDDDVESSIQATLESQATTTEITDRAVKDGDTVGIDFVGKMNGEEFEGGSAKDYSLTIGSGVFIDGFEDSIIGHNAGDTFDWNGKFPDAYGNADLAGKDVTFTITVKSITEQEIPELTDKLVKTLSDKSRTVKEYKKEVKKQLEEDAETTYNETLSGEVWEKVLDNSKVKKYPKNDVQDLSQSLIQQYKDIAEYYEMEYEDFIQEQMNTTVEEFEKQVEEAAKSNVKQTLVTKAIADKENIKMDGKTYKKELKELAKQNNYEDVDALKEAIEEDDLKDIVLNKRVKEWLVEHCIQVASRSAK